MEVTLGHHDVYRPDVVGWRRERVPERPTGSPVTVRPDWVCEVVSPDHASRDTVKKLRVYQRAGVPYYWMVDARDKTVTAMRLSEEGYVLRVRAAAGETLGIEPFGEVPIAVGELSGDDPSE